MREITRILCPLDLSDVSRLALDLMLFGSATNQVVRRATCPVLTLRT